MRSLRLALAAILGVSASSSWLTAVEPQCSQASSVRALPGSDDEKSVLGFSADGKRLLTVGGDSFGVWDVKSGQRVTRIRCAEKRAYLGAFLPGGKTIVASFRGEKEILVFDVASGQVSSRIPQPEAVEDLAVAPDGKTFVSYCMGKGTCLWEINSRKEMMRLRPRTTPKWYGAGLVFSPDAQLIAASDSDGAVHLFDAASGDEVRRLYRKTEVSFVPPISFSPDGRFLAALAQELVRNGEYPDL